MKLIPLTQDRFAIVDDDDYEWLSQFNWHYTKDRKHNKHGYAVRWEARRTVFMHREIMRHHGLLKPGMEVDHSNDCGTDNQKENLRVATHSGNMRNREKHRNNSSGVPGVSWYKRDNKWLARITLKGKNKHLGYFDNIEDAKAARQAAERKYFGEFRHDPLRLCRCFIELCPECERRFLEILNDVLPPEAPVDWEGF